MSTLRKDLRMCSGRTNGGMQRFMMCWNPRVSSDATQKFAPGTKTGGLAHVVPDSTLHAVRRIVLYVRLRRYIIYRHLSRCRGGADAAEPDCQESRFLFTLYRLLPRP
jgi:hypothetical protein